MLPKDGQVQDFPLTFDSETNSIHCACQIGEGNKPFPCIVDTGAQLTAIPQRCWMELLTREEVSAGDSVNCYGISGFAYRARRLPIRITVRNKDLLEFDLGTCKADFLFDRDASETAAAEFRSKNMDKPNVDELLLELRKKKMLPVEMEHILLSVGGGTMEERGLCLNWLGGEPEVCLIMRK